MKSLASKPRCLFCFLLSMSLISPALSGEAAQHRASIAEPSLGRGDTVHIVIENGQTPPSVPTADVRLTRADQTIFLNAHYDAPTTGNQEAVVAAVIPERIALGNYSVVVDLGEQRFSAGSLTIRPPSNAAVHLNELSPPFTYDTEEVYVPDPADKTGVAVPVSDQGLKIGKAEIAGISIRWHNTDSVPLLNDCVPRWPLGSSSNPIAAPSHFSARESTDGKVIICDLPRDAQITNNGEAFDATPLDPSHEMWMRKPARAIKRATFRVALHGSGFQTTRPGDNQLWIDDVRQHVQWDTCSDQITAGDPQNPSPLVIHGEVISAEEVQLCSVPVPPTGTLRLAIGYGDMKSEVLSFRTYSMTAVSVAMLPGLIALVLALIPLFLLSFVQESYRIGDSSYKLRMLFLDPETDTYSLSKLQFYLWTVASLFAYAYLVISRIHVQFASWPDVPSTLPGIIAVSAGTAVGSQLITTFQGSKGAGAESPSIADLITSGGVVAADRLQMRNSRTASRRTVRGQQP